MRNKRRGLIFFVLVILLVLNIYRWLPDNDDLPQNADVHSNLIKLQRLSSITRELENSDTKVKRDIFKPKLAPALVKKNVDPKVESIKPKGPSKEDLAEKEANAALDALTLSGILVQGGKIKALIMYKDDAYTVSKNATIKDRFVILSIESNNITVRENRIGLIKKIELKN